MLGLPRLLAAIIALAMAGAICLPAAAEDFKSEITEPGTLPRLRPDYPIPAEPNQLFYIQRSMNRNTVVYAANFAASGRLDAGEPVKAYWRRYNSSGKAKPLGFVESSMAYGVKSVRRDGSDGAYVFSIAALPERTIHVGLNAQGKPEAFGKVGKRWIRLVYIYLEVDDSGLMPDVTTVDLFGYDRATGKPVREHLTRH